MAAKRKPAETPEERENQLVALAIDLAEKQIREGTVSAQVLAHYVKLGSSRERLEQRRIEAELELSEYKKESMAAAGRMEELYSKAIDAMKMYNGGSPEQVEDEYED